MVKDFLGQEVKADTTIHLTLNKLEPSDLSFSLSVTPLVFQSGLQESIFSPQSSGKATNFGQGCCGQRSLARHPAARLNGLAASLEIPAPSHGSTGWLHPVGYDPAWQNPVRRPFPKPVQSVPRATYPVRHHKLERKVRLALGRENEATLITDLRLFRAQMRRILKTTLYFIEARTGNGVLYKIGVTTRPLEQRLAEIRLDLLPHVGEVELVPLGTWTHRGNVVLYFKHRYRRFQRPIGTLTEYFTFNDVKAEMPYLTPVISAQATD